MHVFATPFSDVTQESLDRSLYGHAIACHVSDYTTPAHLNDHYLLDVSSKPVESKTQTHHGPFGSGRGTAGRRGGAELGRTGRRWVDPARRQPALLPTSESKTLSERLFGSANSLIRM